jgi:hypothetical protein
VAKQEGEPSPRELAGAKLAESGIGDREAKRCRMQALAPAQTRALHPSFKAYPALRIPYFDLGGKETGFYRLRYLGEMSGFDALRKKALRYVQEPGTDSEVYLPPLRDWRAIARDPRVAVLITEGELKAACSTSAGLPTVGLGGVWSWRSARRGAALLPLLEAFDWKDRQAYLVFDSDFSSNPDVVRALVALSRELTNRGARPSVVALPDLPALQEQGKKTGLDDFLVARGVPALEKLVGEAQPFAHTEELWRMNGEVVYIRSPGLVVVLEDGRKVSAGAFKEHAYSNRHYNEVGFGKDGEPVMRKKPLAPAWLAWERRSELARITYRPGQPRVTGEGEYNYWPGWAAEPRRGSVDLWKRLLDYAFAADPAARAWFERWCAYPVQHPGAKLYSASVLWGAQHGTGKSLIGYMLGRVYGKNFGEISEDDLAGNFNEWAENRQFVMGDDVAGGEYKKATMELLKFMITRKSIRINAKFLPTYEVPDCINYYFTANGPDAFALEDTDRRYFVWEMPGEPLPREFYDQCDAWLHGPDIAGALLYHLQRVDLGGFNPREHAMDTPAKRAMIADGKSDVAGWVASLKEDPSAVLRMGGAEVRGDLLTSHQLLALYDPEGRKRVTANGLGRELKRAGIRQANLGCSVRTAKGPQRLYAVRNADRWCKAKPIELAKHWDECFGPRPEPRMVKGKF